MSSLRLHKIKTPQIGFKALINSLGLAICPQVMGRGRVKLRACGEDDTAPNGEAGCKKCKATGADY